jgi:hypothetical protein
MIPVDLVSAVTTSFTDASILSTHPEYCPSLKPGKQSLTETEKHQVTTPGFPVVAGRNHPSCTTTTGTTDPSMASSLTNEQKLGDFISISSRGEDNKDNEHKTTPENNIVGSSCGKQYISIHGYTGNTSGAQSSNSDLFDNISDHSPHTNTVNSPGKRLGTSAAKQRIRELKIAAKRRAASSVSPKAIPAHKSGNTFTFTESKADSYGIVTGVSRDHRQEAEKEERRCLDSQRDSPEGEPKRELERESMIRAMQQKMAHFDLEQDACLRQMETMNEAMELYRRNNTKKLLDKDEIIQLHETEIACLRQQILQLQAQNKDERSAAMTETRTLLRRVTLLQNSLMVAQKERDSFLLAIDRAPSEYGSTTSTQDSMELKETIQELLQQLEITEEEHQREQSMLQEEITLQRRKLERLESEFILIERERDDAIHKLRQSEQQLDVERALNVSDLKKYEEELRKWKERYVQEMKFSNKEAGDMLQKTAVILGSRLSAGILEGIQEEDEEDDENLEPSSSLPTTNTPLPVDTAGNDAYKRLLTRLRSIPRSVPLMEVTDAAVPSVINAGGSGPAWIPVGNKGHHQPMSEISFDGDISIPTFLSKIW